MSGMTGLFSVGVIVKILVLPIAVAMLFGNQEEKKKIKNIQWSVPVPVDLLSRLREFSPVAISKTSGIYLDDVFDIMKGNHTRTAPEVIAKLEDALKKLRIRDAELEVEAAKFGTMIKGFDAIEQRETKKREEQKKLPESGKR